MPRRGRSTPMQRRPAAPAPSRPMSTASAYAPPAAPAPVAVAPKQPGLFAQMAATAGGVAIGSAVGHTIGAAIMGGGGGGHPQQQELAPPAAQVQAQGAPQQQAYNPCQRELQQFLDCAQGQADVSLCAGFNEALRQCKLQYGV